MDVFGHKLGEIKGSRGPPGVGYKLTTEGHYDLDNKKLCNVAAPSEPNDAVNLETLSRMIKMEIRSLYEITARLRSEIDDLNAIINADRHEVDFYSPEEGASGPPNRKNMYLSSKTENYKMY